MTFIFKEEKMRNKRFLWMILTLLLGLLLAACGAAQPAAAPATEAPAAEEPAAPAATEEPVAEAPAATEETAAEASSCAETVTIEFWHLNREAERKVIIQKAIDAFEKDNPCVKVNQTILENEAF